MGSRLAMSTNFPTSLDTTTEIPNSRSNATVMAGNHPEDHNDLADAVLALEAKVGITGSAVGTSLDLLVKSLVFNVKFYGALGDNSTNDTTAIQAAITAASSAGGGTVFFPEGIYLTNKLTLSTAVNLIGVGSHATIVKLRDSQNTALVTTTGFVTTDTAGGIHSFTIADIAFDGNKANQASNSDSGCVQIYGYAFTIRNVRIRNAESVGLYTNYETGVAAPGPNGISMEAYMEAVEVYSAGTDGIYWNGPHDSIWNNVVAHENAGKGIDIETRGSGTAATNSHSWGTSQTYGWYINASGTLCTNCVSEGASSKHVYIGQNDCQWIGGHIFAASGATTGIEIAAASGGHLFNTKVSNCTTAAILFTSDGGNSIFDLNVYATSGTVTSGTQHADTLVRAIANGGATGHSTRTLLLGPWAAENLGTGVGPAALTIDGQGVSPTIPMLRPGSITGVIVRTNDARTNGSLTIEVTKNGTGIGLTAVINAANTAFKATLQAPGTDTFVVGDTIGVNVTTDGSWAPTTSDQAIMVEVVY
jgi:hypothetical protein